jgi:hypothetical protein
MNKDALLATLIGFGVGLVITSFILFGPKLTKYFPSLQFPNINLSFLSKTNSHTGTTKISPTLKAAPTSKTLIITSPLPDSIASTNSMIVSGLADPNSIVVVSGVTNDTAAKTDQTGKYAAKIDLSEGKNEIAVYSYLNETKLNQSVTVYYTPEKL